MSDESSCELKPGKEFAIYAEEICTLFGGCEKCPGYMSANVEGENRTIFCVHWCHKLAPTV